MYEFFLQFVGLLVFQCGYQPGLGHLTLLLCTYYEPHDTMMHSDCDLYIVCICWTRLQRGWLQGAKQLGALECGKHTDQMFSALTFTPETNTFDQTPLPRKKAWGEPWEWIGPNDYNLQLCCMAVCDHMYERSMHPRGLCGLHHIHDTPQITLENVRIIDPISAMNAHHGDTCVSSPISAIYLHGAVVGYSQDKYYFAAVVVQKGMMGLSPPGLCALATS